MQRFQFNHNRTVTAIELDDDGMQSSSLVTIGPDGTYYRVDGSITLNSETDTRVDIQIENGPLLINILKLDYWVIKNLEGFEKN